MKEAKCKETAERRMHFCACPVPAEAAWRQGPRAGTKPPVAVGRSREDGMVLCSASKRKNTLDSAPRWPPRSAGRQTEPQTNFRKTKRKRAHHAFCSRADQAWTSGRASPDSKPRTRSTAGQRGQCWDLGKSAWDIAQGTSGTSLHSLELSSRTP